MKKLSFLLILAVWCSSLCLGKEIFYKKIDYGTYVFRLYIYDTGDTTVCCDYNTAYKNNISGTVTVPDSVIYNNHTWYVTDVFGPSSCTGLTKVVLPKRATYVGGFSGCSNLREINLPAGLKSIGSFADCVSLTEFIIPDGVTSIGSYAFDGCTGLTEINIPDGVTYIGPSAFAGTKFKEIKLPSALTYIGAKAFEGCEYLQSIDIPSSVDTIRSRAFANCVRLTELHLPKSLTYTRGDIIDNCYMLTKLTVDPECDIYDSRDSCNAVMESYTDNLVIGCKGTVIPQGTTAIGSYAFSSNHCPDALVLPESLYRIADHAFYGSTLKKITMPASLVTLGQYAFYKCYYLTEVDMPDQAKLARIQNNAFQSCINLESFNVPANVSEIGAEAFASCSKLRTVTFAPGSQLTTIYGSAFEGCGLTAITLPESLKEFTRSGVFKNCTSLKSVTLPGVTKTGQYTFSGCTSLEKVNFAEGLTVIDSYTFSECTSLNGDIYFPKSLEKIDSYAFNDCTGLDSIGFYDNDNMTFSYDAFCGCSGLRILTLPNYGYASNSRIFDCPNLKRVYSYRKLPLTIYSKLFGDLDRSACELYVPAASVDYYKDASVWKDFIIKGMQTESVDGIATDKAAATPVACYDAQGRRLSGQQHGLNIVRYSDGTTRKVIVR